MADDHLVVNVEEQIAKRLYDSGFEHEAKLAIARSVSLPDDTPLATLESERLVSVADRDRYARPVFTV